MAEPEFEKNGIGLRIPKTGRTSMSGWTWLVLVILVIVVGVWVMLQNSQQPTATPEAPAFSTKTQFVPKGATSLEVAEAISLLNFSKPLPFFEEKNVGQSIRPNATSTSTSEVYLTYGVPNQTLDTLVTAYTEYFTDAGWQQAATTPQSAANPIQLLTFSQESESGIMRVIQVRIGAPNSKYPNAAIGISMSEILKQPAP